MGKPRHKYALNPHYLWLALREHPHYRKSCEDFYAAAKAVKDVASVDLYEKLRARNPSLLTVNGAVRSAKQHLSSEDVIRRKKMRKVHSTDEKTITKWEERLEKLSVASTFDEDAREFLFKQKELPSRKYSSYIQTLDIKQPHLLEFLSSWIDVVGFPIPPENPEPDVYWLQILWNLRPIRPIMPSYQTYILKANLEGRALYKESRFEELTPYVVSHRFPVGTIADELQKYAKSFRHGSLSRHRMAPKDFYSKVNPSWNVKDFYGRYQAYLLKKNEKKPTKVTNKDIGKVYSRITNKPSIDSNSSGQNVMRGFEELIKRFDRLLPKQNPPKRF